MTPPLPQLALVETASWLAVPLRSSKIVVFAASARTRTQPVSVRLVRFERSESFVVETNVFPASSSSPR